MWLPENKAESSLRFVTFATGASNTNVCPQPTAYGVAEFSESFGGAFIEEGGIYTFPSTGEVGWFR